MAPLDLDRIRGKQKEVESKGMGKYFKPAKGRNTVRVFTFDHKVTKEDVKEGHFPKDKLGKTVTELDRPVTRFFPGGGKPVICLSDSDPLMMKYKKLVNSKNKADKEKAKECRPQTSYFLNVVDTSDVNKGVVEYSCPKTVYEKILSHVLDPDYGDAILGSKGQDFVIEFDDNKQGSEMYTVKLRPSKKCDELAQSLGKDTKDFYDPAVFETLGQMPDAVEKDDDEDEDEEEEEDEDDDLDDDDDDSDGDEDEESDDEDSDDEDEDEDEEDEEEDEEDDDLDEDEEEDEKPKGKAKGKPSKKDKKK